MTLAGDIPPTQVMRPSTLRHYVRSFGNRPYRLRWLYDCNGPLWIVRAKLGIHGLAPRDSILIGLNPNSADGGSRCLPPKQRK